LKGFKYIYTYIYILNYFLSETGLLLETLPDKATINSIGCMYLAIGTEERDFMEEMLKNRKNTFEYESRLAASVLYPLLSASPDMAACSKLYRNKQDQLRQSVKGVITKVPY
jgi:hypothetical protein